MKDEDDKLFDPVAGKLMPINAVDIKTAREIPPPQFSSTITLDSGNTFTESIESHGARCGLAIGLYFSYRSTKMLQNSFYFLQRYDEPQGTDYCNTPLHQIYEPVMFLDWVLPLSDGRVMLIYRHSVAIAFDAVPTSVLDLGEKYVFIPASFLKPDLDRLGENQGARYHALLQTLKRRPHTVVPPLVVQ